MDRDLREVAAVLRSAGRLVHHRSKRVGRWQRPVDYVTVGSKVILPNWRKVRAELAT